jgi:hypothetical protein
MSTFWTGEIIDALGEWTEETTGENHVQTAVDRVHSSGERAIQSGATLLRDGALVRHTAETAETAGTVGKAANGVELAMRATFVKQVAKMCGKAGAAGAVVDGAVGGFRAAKYLQDGTIDGAQAMRHVGAEAGCGFVTSASGTAGTLAVFMVTGSMGPAALAAGMGASMGSRYIYRQAVGETLPSDEEIDAMKRDAARRARESFDDDEDTAQDFDGGDSYEANPFGQDDSADGDDESDDDSQHDGGFETIGPDQ